MEEAKVSNLLLPPFTVAFILLFQILSRAGATATTTVTFIIPVFAILFGALVLEEKVTFRIGLGMLVVFAGAALTTAMVSAVNHLLTTDLL